MKVHVLFKNLSLNFIENPENYKSYSLLFETARRSKSEHSHTPGLPKFQYNDILCLVFIQISTCTNVLSKKGIEKIKM